MLESAYSSTIEKLNLGEIDAESLDSEFYTTLEQSGDIKSLMLKYQTELESLKARQDELNKEKDELESSEKDISYKIETAENEIEKIEEKIEKKATIEVAQKILVKNLKRFFFTSLIISSKSYIE